MKLMEWPSRRKATGAAGRQGVVPGRVFACAFCRGTGVVSIKEPFTQCRECRGTGIEANSKLPCLACRGKGVVQTTLRPTGRTAPG